ncbi:uncharacterized protein [Antedon mediterranea]|uniref:uncharacterized protein n=1 Tax=Antedon mediterranea TaxID=105859 RepID=UPI003AF6B6C7
MNALPTNETSKENLTIKNTCKDHFSLLNKLYEAQKQGFLTDISIGNADCRLSCHRLILSLVSGYARDIPVNSNRNLEIPLHEIRIAKTILSQLVEYIYTGQLHITQLNAKCVLDLAIFLQMPELVQDSEDFLKMTGTSQGKMIDHSYKVFQRIVQHIKSIWNDTSSSDVVITSKSVTYFCHRLILSVRSDYFYAMFGSNMAENRKGFVNLYQINPFLLEQIISFLYYQNVTTDMADLFDLMEAADMLQMDDLCTEISKCLLDKICCENCVDIFMFSSQFHVYRLLYQSTKKYIQQDFVKVSEQDSFLRLTDLHLIDVVSTSNVLLHSPMVLVQALDKWCKHDATDRTSQLSNILATLKTHLKPASYDDISASTNFVPEIQSHLSQIKLYQQVSPINRLRPAVNVTNVSNQITPNETILMFVWTPFTKDNNTVDNNTAPAMQRLQTCCFVPDTNDQSGGSWCEYGNLQIDCSEKTSSHSMWTSVASVGDGLLLAVTQQRHILLIDLATNSAKTIPPPCILKNYCQLISLDNIAYLLIIYDSGYGTFFSYNHERETWNDLSPPPSKISMSYRPIFADCVGKIFLIEEHCEQIYEPTTDEWHVRKHTSIPSFQKLRDTKVVAFNEFLIVSNFNHFFFYDTFTGLWAKGHCAYQGIPLKCRGSLFSILPDFLTGLLTIKQIPSISASKAQLRISSKELSNHIIGIQCVSVPTTITKDTLPV